MGLDVLASPVEPVVRLNLEGELEQRIKGQHPISSPFLQPQNEGGYPKTRDNLDPALPEWNVRSLIKEGCISLPQGWAFCHAADYCITWISDLRKLYQRKLQGQTFIIISSWD